MNRRIALVAAAVVLVGAAGIAAAGPVGATVGQGDPVATNETGESGEAANVTDGGDISPGERLSGVIGVQRAEIAGEIDSRAFEVGLNRTEAPEGRAELVAERLNRTEERLNEIERRQRELRERFAAGDLTPGEFAARMAELGARAETIEREANRTAEVARDLPASVRADRGLNETRLDRLRERAGNASGPEVAAIARGIAGNNVGRPLASGTRGPPPNAGPGAGDGPGAGNGPGDGGPGRGDGSDSDGNATDDATSAVGSPGNGPANASGGGSGGDRGAPNGSSGGDGGSGGDRGASDESDGGGQGPPDGSDGSDRGASGGSDGSDRGAPDGSDGSSRGASGGSDGGDGGGSTPPTDEPSSPAGGDRGGGGNGSAMRAANAVDAVAGRLARSLTDGAGLLREIGGGVDG